MTRADIDAGRLVKVLEADYTGYRQQIHAVYYRNTQLAQRITASSSSCSRSCDCPVCGPVRRLAMRLNGLAYEAHRARQQVSR
jgi:hypothetical protein